MANTLIQLKRSSATLAPTSLSAGELAYSFLSDKLFLGNSAGAVIEIGGRYYLNVAVQAYNSANAGYDKANSANLLAFAIGGAVTTANAAIVASFDKANSANLLAFAIGGALGTNNVATSAAYDKANSANILAFQVGGAVTTANAIAIAAYANANSKFASSGGTITGDVSIVGNLTLSGNTIFNNVATVSIGDPLIYLAANNYTSDIVDIGFIANYVNATGSNVHTGLFRDHSTKEYYVFQGYDQEPNNNHIDPNGNNFTLAVLNAALRTSNLNLGGVNAITWITSSYDKANSANLLAFNTGVGANAFAAATIAGANTAVGAGANAFTSATIAGANTAVGTGANTYLLATIAGANTAVGAGANAFASATVAGANTAVGAGANAYATSVGTAANTNAANGSYISTGIVKVPYGGTGVVSFTTNGILYGNSAGDLKVTAAGTEGQVLQASSTGVPSFAMLDGGSF